MRCVALEDFNLKDEFQLFPVSRVFHKDRYDETMLLFARVRQVSGCCYNLVKEDGSDLLLYKVLVDDTVLQMHMHMHPAGVYTLQLRCDLGVIGNFGTVKVSARARAHVVSVWLFVQFASGADLGEI